MWRLEFAFLCLAAVPTVWALDYRMKKVEVQPVESYASRQSIGAVTVAADPYDTDARSFTAFDIKDLNSRGYFPLHVIIQNSSPHPITLRTRRIVVVLPSGQPLYSTPATVVVDGVVKGSLSKKGQRAYAEDLTRRGSPLLDFTGKELTDREIQPGTVASGFLFFFTPEPKKNPFAGSALHIPEMLDEVSRTTLGPFTVSLGETSTKPAK